MQIIVLLCAIVDISFLLILQGLNQNELYGIKNEGLGQVNSSGSFS